MKAKIFEIKKFAVHDGDGIRTTVFFKGCPLRCVWCHNPEGLEFSSQIAYYDHKCINCGECVNVCIHNSHSICDTGHVFNRETCVGCGKCAEVCLGDALKFYGKEMSVDELMPILLEDREFYETSGGGVTLSGGECLMQADFLRELLSALKSEGIHTAVDTCGYVPKDAFDKVIPYTDVFLYDLKAIDEEVHKKCTGRSNATILENLRYLDSLGCIIEVRIPCVPEYNLTEMEKIFDFVSELKSVTKVKVLPYHNLAASKYKALSIKNRLPKRIPTDQEIQKAQSLFK